MSDSKYWNRNVVIRVSVVSKKIEIRQRDDTHSQARCFNSVLQTRQAVSVRNEPRNDLVSVRGIEKRSIGPTCSLQAQAGREKHIVGSSWMAAAIVPWQVLLQ